MSSFWLVLALLLLVAGLACLLTGLLSRSREPSLVPLCGVLLLIASNIAALAYGVLHSS